jgi:hypothetical protein
MLDNETYLGDEKLSVGPRNESSSFLESDRMQSAALLAIYASSLAIFALTGEFLQLWVASNLDMYPELSGLHRAVVSYPSNMAHVLAFVPATVFWIYVSGYNHAKDQE